MRVRNPTVYFLFFVAFFITAQTFWPLSAGAAELDEGASLDDATCLSCHDGTRGINVANEEGEERALYTVEKIKFLRSVHGHMNCIDCHQQLNRSDVPHEKNELPKPNCVSCHQALWDTAKQQNLAKEKARLGVVVDNIESYKNSRHAKSSSSNNSGYKAYCDDCHNTHEFNVPSQGTSKRTNWHMTVPQVCAKCHEDALEEYLTSVHGIETTVENNPKAAVCVDCHSSHGISKTGRDAFQLEVTKECGNCHEDQFATYRGTYHGQINTLGYTFTAKCYDCHGSHKIHRTDNPESMVHPDNRLETCEECHDGRKIMSVTEGTMSYAPHVNTHDFTSYPQMWIAAKFMHGLLLGVFVFFWSHSILWWFRELKDRREGRATQQRILTEELLKEETRQVRRFGWVWRIGHLLFALGIITLVVTGMALYYSYTDWAPYIIAILGGPKMAGLIHNVSAVFMLSVFFLHLVVVTFNIFRKRKSFRWFGPDSLVPTWKDLEDIVGMFKWFFHKGPRPVFERWTYWEKFDYWAVFWGMVIIGGSGTLLAFPEFTAEHFPGWLFNVVMLIHGEEAFLATVFLFTVHFINNHFLPEKFPPPNVVMFTGSQSLKEFRHDHGLQYERLVESGQLDQYLVDAPSGPMTLGSKILGVLLIIIGLVILVAVITAFFGGYAA